MNCHSLNCHYVLDAPSETKEASPKPIDTAPEKPSTSIGPKKKVPPSLLTTSFSDSVLSPRATPKGQKRTVGLTSEEGKKSIAINVSVLSPPPTLKEESERTRLRVSLRESDRRKSLSHEIRENRDEKAQSSRSSNIKSKRKSQMQEPCSTPRNKLKNLNDQILRPRHEANKMKNTPIGSDPLRKETNLNVVKSSETNDDAKEKRRHSQQKEYEKSVKGPVFNLQVQENGGEDAVKSPVLNLEQNFSFETSVERSARLSRKGGKLNKKGKKRKSGSWGSSGEKQRKVVSGNGSIKSSFHNASGDSIFVDLTEDEDQDSAEVDAVLQNTEKSSDIFSDEMTETDNKNRNKRDTLNSTENHCQSSESVERGSGTIKNPVKQSETKEALLTAKQHALSKQDEVEKSPSKKLNETRKSPRTANIMSKFSPTNKPNDTQKNHVAKKSEEIVNSPKPETPELYTEASHHEDFNDSFMLDTQTANLVAHCSDTKTSQTDCAKTPKENTERQKNATAVGNHTKGLNVKHEKQPEHQTSQNAVSPGLFSQQMEESSENVQNAHVQKAIESPSLHHQNSENHRERNSGQNLDTSGADMYSDNSSENLDQAVYEMVSPDTDSGSKPLVTPVRSKAQHMFQNIIESPDLVPASNYERLGVVDTEQDMFEEDAVPHDAVPFSEYQDKDAANFKCPNVANIKPVRSKRRQSKDYDELQKDLEIAMNMSESFSSPGPVENTDKTKSIPQMEDSFTFSMVEQALSEKPTEVPKESVLRNRTQKTQKPELIPGTTAILDAVIDGTDTDIGRQRHNVMDSKLTADQTKTDKSTNKRKAALKTVSPYKPSSNKKKKSLEQSSENSTSNSTPAEQVMEISAGNLNESTGSDFIPDTPEREDSKADKTGTPRRLIGGMGTPKKDKGTKRKEAQKAKEKTTEKDKGAKSNGTSEKIKENTPNKQDIRPKGSQLGDFTPSQSLTHQSFAIIDVAADKRLFKTFVDEWKRQTTFSLSVACDKLPQPADKLPQGGGIGGKFCTGEIWDLGRFII